MGGFNPFDIVSCKLYRTHVLATCLGRSAALGQVQAVPLRRGYKAASQPSASRQNLDRVFLEPGKTTCTSLTALEATCQLSPSNGRNGTCDFRIHKHASLERRSRSRHSKCFCLRLHFTAYVSLDSLFGCTTRLNNGLSPGKILKGGKGVYKVMSKIEDFIWNAV